MTGQEKQQLRKSLENGDIEAADQAMSQLLDVPAPEMLDPSDLIASLDAMERLGEPGQARMFEAFLMFASRWPQVTVPLLVDRINRSPLDWSGRLAAAVIHEVLQNVPDGRKYIDRGAVVAALAHAVDAAASNGVDQAREAITALHDWSLQEQLPEAGQTIVRLLMRAAEEESPKEYILRLARETLEANGQSSLLVPVKERAKQLPSDHPLRQAMMTA
jgi:hypothetical protein